VPRVKRAEDVGLRKSNKVQMSSVVLIRSWSGVPPYSLPQSVVGYKALCFTLFMQVF
jgi:hypothetical protein